MSSVELISTRSKQKQNQRKTKSQPSSCLHQRMNKSRGEVQSVSSQADIQARRASVMGGLLVMGTRTSQESSSPTSTSPSFCQYLKPNSNKPQTSLLQVGFFLSITVAGGRAVCDTKVGVMPQAHSTTALDRTKTTSPRSLLPAMVSC